MANRYTLLINNMYIIILILFCTQCGPVFGKLATEKISLVFVIDDTNSMHDDINQVKSASKLIFNAVMESSASRIENFVLETFNDPLVRTVIITNNEEQYFSALDSINVYGGDDCPEMAMSGIEEALRKSLPGSYMFVFTDASAKDYTNYTKIKSIAQKKSTQIVFVLTGICESIKDPAYVVYKDLAKATSGQVFHLEKEEVNKILLYVAEIVKAPRSVLAEKEYEPGYGKALNYSTDGRTSDVIVSVTGGKPGLEFLDTNKTKSETSVLLKTDNVLVVKVNHTEPGPHKALVGSTTDTKVIVTGATTFNFKHGFSAFKPTSIEDTVSRPIADKLLYLAIDTDDPDNAVELKGVNILDTSYNILQVLPLNKIDKDFYLTEPIKLPNQMFKIQVTGITKPENKVIKRTSRTPIEPQTLMDEGPPAGKAPSITSIKETLKKVNYGDPLELRCKVNAFPKPRIIWIEEKSGQTLSEMVDDFDLPLDYVSVLSIGQVKTNTSYICQAFNDYGEDKKAVTVEAITKFNVVNISKDTDILYGYENSLYCMIDSIPPSNVTWYINGALPDDDDDVEISSDGSVLKVISMQPKLEGKYTCEVRNEVKRQLYSMQVTMPDKALPKIEKSATKVNARLNGSVDINCIVREGVPQPTSSWFFKKYDADDFVEFEDISDVYHIPSVTLDNAGTYRCEAFNDYGKDVKIIDLSVEYPPEIKNDKKVIRIEQDKIVYLDCEVDAIPQPSVTWTFNGDVIENSDTHTIFTNNTLRFKTAVTDDGIYTCEAVNKQGSARKTVRVVVYVPPKIKIPERTAIKEVVGKSLTLPCETSGIPTPIVKWVFFKTDGKTVSRHPDESGSLNLPHLQASESGYYVCTARNSGGSTNLTYTVDVLAPPVITSPHHLKNVMTAVVDDVVLELPCRASGNPKPTITWYKDASTLTIGTDWYDMKDDGTLIVKNVDKISEGSYICVASNEVARTLAAIVVKVLDFPAPGEPRKKLNLQLGERATINCDIPHRPTDILRWYKDSKMIATGELTLNEVKTSDEGLYTCRVNNFYSAVSATLSVVVGNKPAFLFNEEENVEFSLHETAYLSCAAQGHPQPKVTWKHNGKTLNITGMVNEVTMLETNMGRYTCIVSNEHGTISRDFNIINTGCIFKTSEKVDSPNLSYNDLRSISDSNITQVPKGDNVIFTCPGDFIGFAEKYIEGTCVKDTTVEINGHLFDASEIKCNINNTNVVIKSLGVPCGPGHTEMMKVGYANRGKFEETYEICYDMSKIMPVYSTHRTKRSLTGKEPYNATKWFENEFVPYNYDDMYDCEGQIENLSRYLRVPLSNFDNCCYERKQLVNPRDVSPGLPQMTTYSNLNVVPHWSTCNSENWDEVERRTRSLGELDQEFVVHTGISLARSLFRPIFLVDKSNKRQQIPTFLWKVVQDEFSQSSLAIIQVNIPNLTERQTSRYLRCNDICWRIKWMRNPEWRNVEKGFTYCCTLEDFEKVFGFPGVFSPGMQKVLYDVSVIPEHSLS